MVNGLAVTAIVLALVVAAGSGLSALLSKPPRVLHLVGLAVVEAVLLVQAVVAFRQLFTGERPEELATFVGYLLTAVLLPPLAALLGWAERSRWGSMIIMVGCLIIPVMVVRLQQVWGG